MIELVKRFCMRKFTLPHAAKWVVACVSCVVGSLIFQGCGGDSPDPYAELDAAFPNGPVDVQKRMQDKEYTAQISEGSQKMATLANEVAQLEAALAHIKNERKKSLELKAGEALPEVILEEDLAKSRLYQETLAKYNDAVVAVEAQRRKNVEAVRDRIQADMKAYNAKLTEANAKASAMGQPTREEQVRATKIEQVATAEAKPKVAVPTVEALARETGIPVAPVTEPSNK
jgi:hypothetical protein